MFPFPSTLLIATGTIGSAPTFVAASSATGTGTTSANATYPAGIQADDIIFVAVNAHSTLAQDVSPSAPSGFNTADAGHNEIAKGQLSESHGLFWKRATGTESGTLTVTLANSTETGTATTRIEVWRGCTTSGDPFERLSFSSQLSTTGHRGKGLSTAGANRRVVSMFYCQGSATTGAPANGWNEDNESNSSTGSPSSAWSTNSIVQSTAGKVTGCQRTMSASVTSSCWTFALVPTGDVAGAADDFAKVLLQAQFTGSNGSTSFSDDSHYNSIITAAGNAQIQSNKLELDGTGDWAATNTSIRERWQFLTDDFTASDDFTIDLWGVVVDSLAATQTLLTYWDSSAGHPNNRGWSLAISTAGHVLYQYSTNGTTTLTLIDFAASIATGAAHDYRVVRSTSAGEVYLYIDGTKVATATLSAATNLFPSDSPLVIGGQQTQGTPVSMDGRMSAVRIKKAALSTGASYTVETLPLATS